jgi:hypothetical protein
VEDVMGAAVSQVDGRTPVATSHLEDGNVWVRAAASGELIRQWQPPSTVDEVPLDCASRRVMAPVSNGLVVLLLASNASI